MKETVDTYQNLYQVRNVTEIILPDNYMDRIEKLRFNMVKSRFSFQLFVICLIFMFLQNVNETGAAYTQQRNGDE